MPEKLIKKLNKQIQPQWKTCFFAALLVGLMAHLYKITNWLPNWDSLVFRYDSQNMIALGRWFLPVVTSLTSFYDLPFLNGMVAIIFHALGAVCICSILGIRKKITAGLVGAVVVSFSTVTSVMMYNYVADGYSIAFFLSTLAAYFMTKEKPKYFLSILLIALSLGIYQAYITVTVMLVLIYLTDEMIFKGASFNEMWKKALHCLLSGILGTVLYVIILKVLLAVLSVELLDYQGASEAASLSGINLVASLYIVKNTFVKCFFDLSNGVSVYVVLNAAILILTVLYYIKCIIKNKIYKKIPELLMIIFLSAMLIFGAGALAFINSSIDYHNLMRIGYVVFYVFFLIIYERGEESGKCTCAKCWSVLLIAFFFIANQIVIANVSYHKAQIAYEKSYGVLVRIADRIEQTPKASECDKLLVVGALDNSSAYSVNLPPDITGITDGYIIRADDEIVGQSVLCSALNDYCGKDYKFIIGEEKQKLLSDKTVKSMMKWPAENCVAVVDDTIVVRLGTEGE